MSYNNVFYEDDKTKSLVETFVKQILAKNSDLNKSLPEIYFCFSGNYNSHLFKYIIRIIYDINIHCYCLELQIGDSHRFNLTDDGVEALFYYIIYNDNKERKKINKFDLINLQNDILKPNLDFDYLLKLTLKYLRTNTFAVINKTLLTFEYITDKNFQNDIEQLFHYHIDKEYITLTNILQLQGSKEIKSKIFNVLFVEFTDNECVLIINSLIDFSREKNLNTIKLILFLLYEKFKRIEEKSHKSALKDRIFKIIEDFPLGISIEEENKQLTHYCNKTFRDNQLSNLFQSFKGNEYNLKLDNNQNYKIKVFTDNFEQSKLEKQWDNDIQEFDNIFEILPIPICIIDEAYEIIQYNKFFEELFIKIFSKFNRFIIMKNQIKIYLSNWKTRILECFSDEYSESLDLFKADNEDYCFFTKFNLIKSDTNKVIISMSDLSDFVKLSNRMKLIEKQYSELIGLLPMSCVLIVDNDYKIKIALGSELPNIFLNSNSSINILPEYLINKNIYNYFDDASRCFLREHLTKTFKEGFCNQEHFISNNYYSINTRKVSNYFYDNNESSSVYIIVFHNITEKKILLDKITDSEKKLNAFYQNSAVGMFKVSPEGNIIKCNPAFCLMLKLPYDYNLTRLNLFKDVHLSNSFLLEKDLSAVDNILSNKNIENPMHSIDFNRLYLRNDKQVIYVIENLRPVYAEAKQIEYYEGTVINMTEIINAKNLSKENELKYKLLADNQNDIILTVDKDFNLTYCSPAIEKILNISTEEILNVELFDLIDIDCIEQLQLMFNDLFVNHLPNDNQANGDFADKLSMLFDIIPHHTFELCLLSKSYQKIWTEVTISKLLTENNIGIGYLLVIKDINDKVLMKDKLSKFEDKYHNVFDHSPVGIIIINSKGIIIDHNSAILRLLKTDSLENKHISTLNISKRQTSFIVGSLLKYKRLVNYEIEYELINYNSKKMDKVIYLRLNCGAFNETISNNNEILYFILAEDISKETYYRKNIENNLKEKELLLQEIHHRVKNNLQIVCSMLFLEANKSKNKKVIKTLEESYNRIRSMAMIHEKLYSEKSFDYINIKRYITDLSNYLIKSLARDTLKLEIYYFIEDISLSISQAISCGLIINELLSNSIKYAFNDIGSFNQNKQNQVNPRITISLEQTGENVVLTVQDNGKKKSSNFNPFNKKTLGLHLVKTLTQQLHGKLKWVHNHGLVFKICFPLEPSLKGGNLEKETNLNNRR
jgi:PAS domain S-box-containing protein